MEIDFSIERFILKKSRCFPYSLISLVERNLQLLGAFAKLRLLIHYCCFRWAVKEATLKAFGSRLHFPEIFVNTKNARPSLQVVGSARKLFDEKGIRRQLVSISHETEYAIAFVVLES